MINFDDYTIIQMKTKKKHNSKWAYIPVHPYRILIIGVSVSGKTNALLNLINNQPDIDEICFYAKNPYEAKYQYSINQCEKVGLKHFNDSKSFIEYSNDMQDVYKKTEEQKIAKKCSTLIVFDDMTADMIHNKKRNPVVTELFIKGTK